MAGLISSIKLENIVMEASQDGDIAPILSSAPSLLSAISTFNKVQVAIINGGPVVQAMGWKWNRTFPTPFLTISWQQDYASNALNIGWLENCQAIDVNNTTVPKPAIDVYAVKDLTVTNVVAYPKYICWLPNYQLMYGSWGSAALNNTFGLTNPGPGVVYTNPFGQNKTPSNPITQIQDSNGNYWILTTYGTCGTYNPFAAVITATAVSSNVATITAANQYVTGQQVIMAGLTTNIWLNGQTLTIASSSSSQFTANATHTNYGSTSDSGTASLMTSYPTYANPFTLSTLAVDGSCLWTAVNPQAQGFRIGPIPSQTGRVWGIRPVAQTKPQPYSALPTGAGLEQFISPIPDELYTYFLDGFKILNGMNATDTKVRAKYQSMYPLWIQSLDNCIRTGNREPDNFMFMPTSAIQQPAWGVPSIRSDYPFGPPYWG